MHPTRTLTHGRPEGPPAPEVFRAGPLRLLYEPDSGFVRRIRLGEREVLRGIYVAVRDPNWDTIPGTLVETRRDVRAEAFYLEFACRHRRAPIDLVWRGTITGGADGLLRYTFEGEALGTFRRNRIGFCVLHPIHECAGALARQVRVDGCRFECRFPDAIEPQVVGQGSFRELQSVAHEVEPGVWADVSFAGDIFEMEDQRNWTDASFKTYCTPLALPFPVEIPAGTRFCQSVTLRLEGWTGQPSRRVTDVIRRPAVRLQLAAPTGTGPRFPRLGLGLASHGQALTPSQVGRLRALGLSHLRVDLRLAASDWPRTWDRAAQEAAELGVQLEVSLHIPRDGQFDGAGLRRRLENRPELLARVLALRDGEAATSRETLATVRGVVEGWGVPVGAGSDANFCELNREHALGGCVPAEADFVFFPITPQVHASDDLSVMEALEAQVATARSARALAHNRPLVVSPVTLRRRFNPVATGPEAPLPPGELPRPVDPRQAGLFGAAWTVGSLAELASAGTDAITYYETTGWRGVLELDEGSAFPAQFASVPGGVFPLYHVFADLAGWAGSEVLRLTSTAPRTVAALALRRAGGSLLLLANLGEEPCVVELEGGDDLAWIRSLAADTVTAASLDPALYRSATRRRLSATLELPAFGLACLLTHP